jgi:hypothetical protein
MTAPLFMVPSANFCPLTTATTGVGAGPPVVETPVTPPALEATAEGETSVARVGVAVALACDAAPDGTATGPQPIKSATTAPMGLPTNRARCFLSIFLPSMTPGSGAEFRSRTQPGFAGSTASPPLDQRVPGRACGRFSRRFNPAVYRVAPRTVRVRDETARGTFPDAGLSKATPPRAPASGADLRRRRTPE